MAAITQTQIGSVLRASRRADRAGGRRRGGPSYRSVCLTDRDVELLGFVAAHRFVLARHVSEWMGAHEVVAYRRLRGLLDAGLLSYRRIFHARPGCYQVTSLGLGAVESRLPRPTIDLRSYRHDAGVVWLWLAASRGVFGAVERALSEREMRSHDQWPDHGGELFAIPLGGYGRGGKPLVHFPDVVVVRRGGSRVALELELTLKSRPRLEAILAGYLGERRLERLIYLTDSEAIASALGEAGLTFGLEGLLQVQYFDLPRGRTPERTWENLMDDGGER